MKEQIQKHIKELLTDKNGKPITKEELRQIDEKKHSAVLVYEVVIRVLELGEKIKRLKK